MKTLYTLTLSAALALSFSAISCDTGGGGSGSGGGTSGNYCDSLKAKANSCGWTAATAAGVWDCEEPEDDVDACEAQCYAGGSCTDLTALICQSGSPSASFVECLNACSPEPFVCADGETGEDYAECDGFPDCTDGSDEHDGCPAFTCADGTKVQPWDECNGYEACPDGSDEHDGCKYFTCGDGTKIPEDWYCDGGEPDCGDGTDEPESCPMTMQEAICGSAG